jgi:UDP-N-acetyl-D-glucosamine dehydrogenase
MHGLKHEMRLLETATLINRAMPCYVVDRLAAMLNEDKLSVRGQSILVVGVAYKPSVSDTRESPALDVIRELERRGAAVDYVDPHVPTLTHEGIDLPSLDITEDQEPFDAAVITTAHGDVDYARMIRWAPRWLDTRNALRNVDVPAGTKVEFL